MSCQRGGNGMEILASQIQTQLACMSTRAQFDLFFWTRLQFKYMVCYFIFRTD